MVTHIKIVEERSGYTTLARFGGFVLNTMDMRIAWFGPQNQRVEFRVARGVIREFMSRRSYFMKGL